MSEDKDNLDKRLAELQAEAAKTMSLKSSPEELNQGMNEELIGKLLVKLDSTALLLSSVDTKVSSAVKSEMKSIRTEFDAIAAKASERAVQSIQIPEVPINSSTFDTRFALIALFVGLCTAINVFVLFILLNNHAA